MNEVKKITIGVMPIKKMYRVRSLGGQIVDDLITLQLKSLPEDYFGEVMAATDGSGYKVSGRQGQNVVHVTQDTVTFARDYYESTEQFNLDKVRSEFRTVWTTVNAVLQVQDIRRIGIVTEYRYEVGTKHPSVWLREHIAPMFAATAHCEKFVLRFEDRSLTPEGKLPDPKKSVFYNTIYQIYDSEQDTDHPKPGFVTTNIDAQKYFAPVITGKQVLDEVDKLHKVHDSAAKKLDEQMKKMGASNGKR